MLTEAAISEANHLKLATKRSTKGFNISHASSSGDGVGKLSKVLDEQEQKDTGTDEGSDTLSRVLDVPKYESESVESWEDSEEEGDDDDNGNNDDEGGNDDEDDDVTESDDEQTEYENDDDGSDKEEDVEESAHTQSDEEKFDYEESNDYDESMNNKYDEEVKELYDNANLNLGNTDAEMTDADQGTTEQHTAYAVAVSLSKLELKKILMDKMEANKSIERSDTQKTLYNALVTSYNSDKDNIPSYGDVVLLKRGHDDKDKDQDPFAGSDRRMKSYLEEIEVRRDDQQIYTFKEGDFPRLRLQDIEEMLLLLTQRRLPNLTVDKR
nr:hypothetical protein [Tanacetum cinerariifolium]